MKQKTIVHVDGNNFFASCEIMMNPALKGRAVCVLSNNDGCVVARSYEAKKMGIPMGIPYFMAKNQFKDVVYLSAYRGKRLNGFSLRPATWQAYPFLPLQLNTVLET